mgnify:CR=1 FL=1
MREVNARIAALEEQLKAVEQSLEQALLTIPNLPRADVPVGPDERSNVVVRLYDVNETLAGTATSSLSGAYGFTDVPPGAYVMEFTPPSGYLFTSAAAFFMALSTVWDGGIGFSLEASI